MGLVGTNCTATIVAIIRLQYIRCYFILAIVLVGTNYIANIVQLLLQQLQVTIPFTIRGRDLFCTFFFVHFSSLLVYLFFLFISCFFQPVVIWDGCLQEDHAARFFFSFCFWRIHLIDPFLVFIAVSVWSFSEDINYNITLFFKYNVIWYLGMNLLFRGPLWWVLLRWAVL